MLQNIACFVAIALGLFVSALAQTNTSRIVGGIETTISDCPFLVQVLPANSLCGGSLVKPNFVVTAAHCFHGITAGQVIVRAGTSIMNSGGQMRKVASIFRHGNYNKMTMAFDVVVLKLVSPFILGPNVKTIELFTGTFSAGLDTKIYGWGTTSSGGVTAEKVRTAVVPTIAKDKCQNDYNGQAVLTNSMYCASVPGQKDSCQGDSGGPATYNGMLFGIVSWGIGCADGKYPGVYTNVAYVKTFINSHLQN